MIKKVLLFTILSLISNCGFVAEVIPFGRYKFTKPYTLEWQVPDGPPEFQAGWYDGCRAGLSNSSFLNVRMFAPVSAGSGIYQHDPLYQMAYGRALFSCAIQAGNFVSLPSYNMPLDHAVGP